MPLMDIKGLLVANRGEIAIRVLRGASDLGLRTVAVYSEDDATSLHTRAASDSRALRGTGAAAYLDAEQMVALAAETGCDAIHPGYGFLAENARFARLCAQRGVRFIGPRADTLELLGDKLRARELAVLCQVPVLAGSGEPAAVEDARSFLASLDGAPMLIKAIGGGGGRGLRIVRDPAELDAAYERCVSEARAAFGDPRVYVEACLESARHIEVQIVGDRAGAVAHIWERDCTLQRRHQKLVEIAPAPGLSSGLRDRLIEAALRMAREVAYESLGTFEFLVADDEFAFIEANPRLQVEHTVTEAVTGVDLVQTQLRIEAGATLEESGVARLPEPRGFAVQARVNLETMTADGEPRPAGGTLRAFELPSGPGVRVDTYGYAGYATNPNFDSLLVKVIGYVADGEVAQALRRTRRALGELRIEGVETNREFLRALLAHPEVLAQRTHTRFVEQHAAELLEASALEPAPGPPAPAGAGARVDAADPLAVLEHGRSVSTPLAPAAQARPERAQPVAGPEGTRAVLSPLQGTLISIDVAVGDLVHAEQQVAVMEAMKMEHVITAGCNGSVRQISVAPGDSVYAGHALLFVEPGEVERAATRESTEVDLDRIRPDLAEVRSRHEIGLDASRPEAVARRRKIAQRTARENVEDLCDPGSFVEYGALVLAAQRRRRSLEDLIAKTPADGLVAGVGSVNGDRFDESRSRCVVLSYDYTVLAGTQGAQNHRKKDRMFELAEKWQIPLVFFTEGGGGRPGDTDGLGVAGLDCMAFHYFGRLSGLVPLVGINAGRCFAGNAALLGCCDVVIATQNSNIGMGGPAMIEGGGLGVFHPEEVGPMDVQVPNGVVDVAVRDEAEGVRVAKRYLSYFQGSFAEWAAADQRLLRTLIPENRLRIYDVRRVIETLADTDSVLELRRGFGPGMVTALIRVEGRPLGVVANNPTHLAGAIDSDAADKAARFMQLCDAFDIPLLFLCDTPGIMVGPEVEKTALVRHAARMFVTGASLSVPFFTIVLRKSYGLGAQAMAGGSFKAPFFTVSWPTGEFGGMGLEGAVKLGFRNELAAIQDPEERRARFEEMVEQMYERGKAVSTASYFELDDVIDPMDSRRWILRGLASVPPPPPLHERSGKKRPCVDTW